VGSTILFFYLPYHIISGAVTQWYVDRGSAMPDVEGGQTVDLGTMAGAESQALLDTNTGKSNPVWGSITRTLRFHLGSICFGSGLIALCKFITRVLKFLERRTRGTSNPCARCLNCMVMCCIHIIEKLIEKITMFAFAWQTIYGTPFIPSALQSSGLLVQNLARIAALYGVSWILIFIGKFVVTIATTGIVFVYAYRQGEDDTFTFVFLGLVTFIGSWMLASLVLVIYQTANDSLFLCFLLDEKFHGQPTNAPASFVNLVDLYKENSNKLAKEQGPTPTPEGYQRA